MKEIVKKHSVVNTEKINDLSVIIILSIHQDFAAKVLHFVGLNEIPSDDTSED